MIPQHKEVQRIQELLSLSINKVQQRFVVLELVSIGEIIPFTLQDVLEEDVSNGMQSMMW